MKIKAVVFDFDYTLGDSTDGIIRSANYGLEQMGYPPGEREDIRRTIGLSLIETYKALTGDEDEDRAAKFRDYFVEKADEIMAENTVFYSGVLEFLDRLKRAGYLIGVVTTKYHYRIDQIAKQFHADELFDQIVGGDDVTQPKPDPEGLLSLLKIWNLDKDEVLYVGDSLVDAKTARAAGIAFAAVTTGTTEREAFLDFPHLLIMDSIEETQALLAEQP